VRHFGLHVDQRPALRDLLRQLQAEGVVARSGRRRARDAEKLPEMAVVEVFGTDPDGDPLARPVEWEGTGRPPLIYMRPERPGQPALAPGERVMARLRSIGGGKYDGRTFKRLGGAMPMRVLGIFQRGRLVPVDKRQKSEWTVPVGEEHGAEPGELVLAEPINHLGGGMRPVRVVERLGRMDAPSAVSIICIYRHNIPEAFSADALREAEAAGAVDLAGREDLRDIPLVTIDGEDARDFDDAVWAERREDGWRVVVAIADVAHYVRTGSALDDQARSRGNSVYFPDRVVPMLPEALSNGWCSLKPGENRGCLFVNMQFDFAGRKTGHRFGRGLMRSAARLTYEAVQEAREREEMAETIAPLYGAFTALLAAREARGTLELDLPERRVLLDENGQVRDVVPRIRLDSHRLIEEFMVAANVCAAETLEQLHQPCMYRVHDRPSDEKLEGLRQFLDSFDLDLPTAAELRPRHFAEVLERTKHLPEARLVHEAVLRGQSQAAYSPENIGHFGLALPRYAHFTSPIRRYADLLVHRALIAGLKLGPEGILPADLADFADIGDRITRTERRAAAAERDAMDRYLTGFMATRIGNIFAARISGVTRFGLFVTVEENGASGIVPLSSLPDDRWTNEEAAHRLSGRNTRLVFSLGQAVEVRLTEAAPLTGGLVFNLLLAQPAPRGAKPR
jgi:ribonuclease R